MTYVLALLDKEIRISDSKLSLLKKEAEPGFDSLWDKGFNEGSRMYLENHYSYLIALRQKLSNITNDDDDDF
jgi:hypothetical protein